MLDKIFGPLARRWRWAAVALKVQNRFTEVRGGFLASAVTLTVFLSIFPLMLVGIAIIGFITSNSTDLPEQIVSTLGITGPAADMVINALNHAAETKRAATIIGILGLAWAGLGIVSAIEFAMDATWQQTGRGIMDKVRGIAWVFGAFVILFGSAALATYIQVWVSGILLTVISIVVALIINTLFWIFTFVSLSYPRLPWRAYLPGSILGAIGFEILRQLVTYLPQLFEGASALYGSIGVVFGALAILLLLGRLAVYASTLNVILWEGDRGTRTIDVDVPNLPGDVPTQADRSGAVEKS